MREGITIRDVNRCVLALNSGSSSLKFALFRGEERLASGAAEKVGQPDGELTLKNAGGEMLLERKQKFASHSDVMAVLLGSQQMQGLPDPEAVGHRLVHGGPEYSAPARIDAALTGRLREIIPLAPLHLPSAIDVIEAVAAQHPEIPQVVCFDTAFHQDMPELAKRLPLPRELWDRGVRRYGFHGLSYQYIVSALGPEARGKVVIAHLGNGASCAALQDGKPVDTTMGLTPAGGLMMGTRTGDLDPGVLLYLLREFRYSVDALEKLVDKESGLLGVSGRSADVRTLTEAASSDPDSAQALEMFCYIARKQIAAMAAALGGIDLLVFTGGIGEHAENIRDRICAGLSFLNFRVRVIQTDEDLIIARQTNEVLDRTANN